jgi:hypothetical protein
MMRGHGQKMSRKAEQAVAALLAEPTIEQAAQKVGIGEQTLKNWLKRPEFQRIYSRARHVALGHSIARASGACGKAMDALIELVGPSAPASVRVQAAKVIMEITAKHTHAMDVLARLNELEDHIRGKPASSSGNGRDTGPGWLIDQVEAQRRG